MEKKIEALPIICSECGKEKEKRFESETIEKYKELFDIDLRKHSRHCRGVVNIPNTLTIRTDMVSN